MDTSADETQKGRLRQIDAEKIQQLEELQMLGMERRSVTEVWMLKSGYKNYQKLAMHCGFMGLIWIDMVYICILGRGDA